MIPQKNAGTNQNIPKSFTHYGFQFLPRQKGVDCGHNVSIAGQMPLEHGGTERLGSITLLMLVTSSLFFLFKTGSLTSATAMI